MKRKKFTAAYLELTNVCNASCSFCKGTNRKKGWMSSALFQKLLLQAHPLAENIYLHVMGEALLHPDFREMVSFAAGNEIKLSLTTNGTLFGTENAESLFSGVFRQINVSLHAGLAEKHLDKLFSFLTRLKEKSPQTYCNLRMWNTGTSDRENVLKKISVFFGVPVPDRAEAPVRLSERFSMHFDPEFEWPSPDLPDRGSCGTCRGAVRQFAVLCDGTVTPCCLDADGLMNCGNASEQGLKEILSSGRFEKLRNGFLRGEILEDLCRKCSYRLRFSSRRTAFGSGVFHTE